MRRVLSTDGTALCERSRRPVCVYRNVVYDFARSGGNSIMSFTHWLIMISTLWSSLQHHTCCDMTGMTQTRYDVWWRPKTILRSSAESTHEDRWNILIRIFAKWRGNYDGNNYRSICSRQDRPRQCVVISFYVNDCDLDAVKALRALVWKIFRTHFNVKDPVHMQKLLDVVNTRELRRVGNHVSSVREYDKNIARRTGLEMGPIRVYTTVLSQTNLLIPSIYLINHHSSDASTFPVLLHRK